MNILQAFGPHGGGKMMIGIGAIFVIIVVIVIEPPSSSARPRSTWTS